MRYKRGYYDDFIRACAKYSSRTAIKSYSSGGYKDFTYSELYGICEYIAQNLQHLQCSKGIVGLISDRNAIVPSAIAAAHKCCRTFMFLDTMQDIEKISNEIKLKVILSIEYEGSSVTSPITKQPERTINIFNYTIKFYNFYPSTSLQNSRYVNKHSFIAMTSGSTGVPSQIQVPIQCLQPNVEDLTKLFHITEEDNVYFSTPLTFDPSMVEILLACMNGASLLIAPEKLDVIFCEDKNYSVTFWQTTPSRFFQHSAIDLQTYALSAKSTLKILALGGEPLIGVKRLSTVKDVGNETRIFTLYGVTEMSCWACAAELDLNKILTDREVPLGNCLSETQLIVEPTNKCNKNTGKIMLVSDTRKCVILNKPNNTLSQESSKIDTGDLAEVRNGTVYYAGRTDDIIKRFGHKINLKSIESVIMQCPEVKSCSCIWLPKPFLLVVYYTSESLNTQELSDFLKCKLDDKHWPDNVIRVNNLPINSHGKTTRLQISKLHEKNVGNVPIDTIKKSFLHEISSLLNRKFNYQDIKDKDFYLIGGTSFLAVTLCNKLSLTYPEFARYILPHIISQRTTIEEVLQLGHKEMCTNNKRLKKSVKRVLANETETSASKSCKRSSRQSNQIEFTIQWMYNTKKCVDASPTVFQTERNIYVTVGSHSGLLVVFDAKAGILHGKISVKSRVEASVFCCYIAPETPCGVVGTYDGTIICFNLNNCIEMWKINIKYMIKSKATCCKGILYVAAYDGNIHCIDIKTGAIKNTISISEQAISADLVVAKNQYVLVGSLSGACGSVHVDSAALAWRGTLSSPVFANPVLCAADKYVLFAEVNGEIHCKTVDKGIRIWKYQGAKGNIFSSMYIKETSKLKWQMIFGCHDSNVYSIKIKNLQPSLDWKCQVSAPVYASPCALNEELVLAVSNDGKLHVIDKENGFILKEFQLPEKTFSSPAVCSDYIFIGCRNDNLYSIKINLNL